MFEQAPLNRRDFLAYTGASALSLVPGVSLLTGCAEETATGETLNDAMSRLNETRVKRVVRPEKRTDLQKLLADESEPISISGSRHSMGGQQFREGSLHLDMRGYSGITEFSPENRTVTVRSGTKWPRFLQDLMGRQEGEEVLTIRQKQTGANHFTIGGSLATNIHGRGLDMKPMVSDVESFRIIDAEERLHRCSREQNEELFSLAIGGYGLFGIVDTVTLRLKPRRPLRRTVEEISAEEVLPTLRRKRENGFRYGDYQLCTDEESEGFLRTGLLSCYRPVVDREPITGDNRALSKKQWLEFAYLAHADPGRAWKLYKQQQKSMDGQVLWSDYQYFTQYVKDYHRRIDKRRNADTPGSEVITEFHVPRQNLVDFLEEAAGYLSGRPTPVIYGVVRLIEREETTFLNWADRPYACVLFNLHVNHSEQGIERARRTFQGLLDQIVNLDGGYYLTYLRWARKEQVRACYPQFPEFLRQKKKHDPGERFQSDWYRFYRKMFDV